jgi:hypothetical protein
MNINIVVFSWPKEYSDIVMRSGYSIPHTREHLNIVNIVMRRILIQPSLQIWFGQKWYS